MRKTLLCAAAALALSACDPQTLQLVQSDIDAGVNAACNDVMAAYKLNPGSAVAPWAINSCGSAVAIAGLVKNSATIAWLGGIAAQLGEKPAQAATPAAS